MQNLGNLTAKGVNARVYNPATDGAKKVPASGAAAAGETQALADLPAAEAPTHILTDGAGHEVAIHINSAAEENTFVHAFDGQAGHIDLTSAVASAALAPLSA